MAVHKTGDLVHIPQAVVLIDYENEENGEQQLTIPLRVEETDRPKIGVVTGVDARDAYVKVYCEGNTWSVKNDSIYTVTHGTNT